MPVYIGDYLADTMHLSTEQHGAYLLLLFHLWRRGTLPDHPGTLAKITGLSPHAWKQNRPVLAPFFEINDGTWRHGRVDRERSRLANKQQAYASKAKHASSVRWQEHASSIAPGKASGNASSMPQALLEDAEPQSQTKLQNKSRADAGHDARHTLFRGILGEYWQAKNLASPEMPWQGRDGKALKDFLSASPQLTETQFRQMLGNRARSAVAHGDRVYLWIGNLTRYQEEMTIYNRPVSAGGGNASRASINRDSVVSAVDRALTLARAHADRAGQPGAEPAGFDDAGMPVADGAGPERCALAGPGESDHRVAAGDAAHGQTRTDGPLPHGAPVAAASGPAALRRVGA
jgi:uncharacterized protein YdaU (DUF1376 family)